MLSAQLLFCLVFKDLILNLVFKLTVLVDGQGRSRGDVFGQEDVP